MDGARISTEDLSPEVIHPRRQSGSDRSRWRDEQTQGSVGNNRHALGAMGGNGGGFRGLPAGGPDSNSRRQPLCSSGQLIAESLIRNKNNLSRTAIDLGLSRRGLRLKLAQLGIQRRLVRKRIC